MGRLRLPIPVVIMALTGALALLSALAGRAPQAASAPAAAQRVQASEQQPAALAYFRVMNWLLRLLPGSPANTPAAPPAAAPAKCMKASRTTRATREQLCALRVRANPSVESQLSISSTQVVLDPVGGEN